MIVSLALYKPLGIAGLIIGTLAANVVMAGLQIQRLRTGFNGRLELDQTAMITARILVATAISTAVGWLLWKGLDAVLGRSLIAQIVAMGIALTAAGADLRAAGAADADPRGPPDRVPDHGPLPATGRRGLTAGATASPRFAFVPLVRAHARPLPARPVSHLPHG